LNFERGIRDAVQDKVEQGNQELDAVIHMYRMRFHSLSSVSVIPVCVVSWSPKSYQCHWTPYTNFKGPEYAVWTVPTRFAYKNTSYIHMLMVLKLFLIFILLFVCWSLVRSLVCPSANPQIWTNSYRARHRLRTYDWLLHSCTLLVMTSNYSWRAWVASAPFHLLYQVRSLTSVDTLSAWRMRTIDRVRTILFAWYKYADTCRGGKIWVKRNNRNNVYY